MGDINLVVAVAAAHRQESFAACQYTIDQFKQILPTREKKSTRTGALELRRKIKTSSFDLAHNRLNFLMPGDWHSVVRG